MKDKSKEVKPVLWADKRLSTITSPVELKTAKKKEPKVGVRTVEMGSSKLEPMQDIPSGTESIEVVEELSAGLLETFEELSSSTLMEVSAKRSKLQISVDKVLDEEVLKSHDSVPVEDLTIDLGGSVCVVCSR